MGEDGCLDEQRCVNRNEKRVSSWAISRSKVHTKNNPSSQKKPAQSTSKGLLQNILRIFSQNTLQSTFMMDRNGILRSYPILSDLCYPKSLVVIAPEHGCNSCAVRM